jgi:hypothetical protein
MNDFFLRCQICNYLYYNVIVYKIQEKSKIHGVRLVF